MSAFGHKRRRLLTIVLGFGLLATVLSGCRGPFQKELTTRVKVSGPLRGYVEEDGGGQIGYTLHEPRAVDSTYNGFIVHSSTTYPPGYTLVVTGKGQYTGRFVVADAGPILIEVNSSEPSEGLFDTGGGLLSRALFFIEGAPVGATVSLKTHSGQDPDDLRVSVDRDADGEVDDQLQPVGIAGEDAPSYRSPASHSTIEELPDGQVRVTLTGATSSDTNASEEIQLYYALYPQAPEGRLYDGPFIVDGPSYLIYGAFDAYGEVGMLNEEHLLGGLAEDLEFELPVDGSPVEVNLNQPGQQAVLTYPAQDGDKFELVIEPSTIGVFPDAGLRSKEIIGRDGGTFYPRQRRSTPAQILLDPDWGYTGTVVVRLINLYEHAPELVVDGPAMELEVRPADHHGYAQFTAERGHTLVLRIIDIEIDDAHGPGVLRLFVADQDGNTLVQRQPVEGAETTLRLYVRHSASYLMEVTPEGKSTGSVTLELRHLAQ